MAGCCGISSTRRHTWAARQAITELLDAAQKALLVCDLNLRPPYYTSELVRDALSRCRWLKLNDAEVRVVQEMLDCKELGEDTFLFHLLQACDLELVCVTLGAQAAQRGVTPSINPDALRAFAVQTQRSSM